VDIERLGVQLDEDFSEIAVVMCSLFPDWFFMREMDVANVLCSVLR